MLFRVLVRLFDSSFSARDFIVALELRRCNKPGSAVCGASKYSSRILLLFNTSDWLICSADDWGKTENSVSGSFGDTVMLVDFG